MPDRDPACTAPKAQFYLRQRSGVNVPVARCGRWGRRAAVTGAALGSAILAGCAVTAKPLPTRSFPLRVRYDVEPRIMRMDRSEALRAIRADFQRIAALGFDGVALRFAETADRQGLLDAAEAEGLRALLFDRDAEFYVLTGVSPGDLHGAAGVAATIASAAPQHPAVIGFMIDAGRSPAALDRASSLAVELQKRGFRCVLASDNPASEGVRTSAEVDLAEVSTGATPSPTVTLLARFHSELSLGRTSGLLVDRFYRVPGEAAGFGLTADEFGGAPASAVSAVLARARAWGPRLAGLPASPIAGGLGSADGVQLTVLAGHERRYLLIWNPDLDRPARGSVVLPEMVGGRAVGRAVEVPSAADRPPAVVDPPREGPMALDVDLRPGEAMLLEIF